jgi:hypothetical protein
MSVNEHHIFKLIHTLVKLKLYNKARFIFQPSKVSTKICTRILICAHISFKINIPHKRTRPPGGVPHSLGTSALACKLNYILSLDHKVTSCLNITLTQNLYNTRTVQQDKRLHEFWPELLACNKSPIPKPSL